MKPDRWEAFDKGALYEALLALHTCPKCRRDLRPVWSGEKDVWACVTCDETWHVPEAK
jgi:ribosomal protein L37AE/L43A